MVPSYGASLVEFGRHFLLILRSGIKNVDQILQGLRSEEHTSELQSVRISYAVFCLKKKNVSVRVVSKQFSTAHGCAALALRSFDLEIPACRFIPLVGPSGCGKSTLLQIIGGLMPASA